MASLSFLTEGLAKCRRKENGMSSFGKLLIEPKDGEGDKDEGTTATERSDPTEGVLGVSKVHDRPMETHREHGAFLSQAALAEKQASQDCLFLPGRAAGGHGWLCFAAHSLVCLRVTSLGRQVSMLLLYRCAQTRTASGKTFGKTDS
jgi:hypothetical protein